MAEKRLCRILELAAVFISGGFAYGLIEVAARGYTHISMGLLGGLAMLLIHRLNSRSRTLARVLLRSLVCAVFITVCELVTGELLNVRMGLRIWDYSSLPLNLDGQICPLFSAFWFLLSAVGSLMDDMLRFAIFRSRKLVLFGGHGICPSEPEGAGAKN